MEAKRKNYKTECMESVPTLLGHAEGFEDCCDPEIQLRLIQIHLPTLYSLLKTRLNLSIKKQ